jgi:hypothetical protein
MSSATAIGRARQKSSQPEFRLKENWGTANASMYFKKNYAPLKDSAPLEQFRERTHRGGC